MRTRPFHQNCGKLVKCDECRYWDWCDAVMQYLEDNERVRGKRDDESVPEFFERCRGDEPLDTFEIGHSAKEYADFIMTACPDDGDTGYMEEVEL